MHLFKNIKNSYVRKNNHSLFGRIDCDMICSFSKINPFSDWGGIELLDSKLFSDIISELRIEDYVLQTEVLFVNPGMCIPIHNDQDIGTFSIGIGIKNSEHFYMLEIDKKYNDESDKHLLNVPLIASKKRTANVPRYTNMSDGIKLVEKIYQQKSIIGDDALLSNTKNYHTAANYGEKTAWMISFRLNEKFDYEQYLSYTK